MRKKETLLVVAFALRLASSLSYQDPCIDRYTENFFLSLEIWYNLKIWQYCFLHRAYIKFCSGDSIDVGKNTRESQREGGE